MSAVVVPAVISNAPGLPAIHYRIGTFTSFRRAMLDRIALPDLMAGAVTSLLQDVGPADKNITVLDAAGFPAAAPFRVRIGAEYLLVTGVVVSGTVGVNTWIATRGSPASAHVKDDAVIFDPPNPFSAWHEGIDSDYQTMFVELWAYLGDVLTFYQERIANEAFLGTATQRDSLLRLVNLIDYHPSPGAAASGLVAFTVANSQSLTVPASFRVGSRAQAGKPAVVFETASAAAASADNNAIPLALLSPDTPYAPGTIVLQGLNNRLALNDFLLAVEDEGTAREIPHLLRITRISTDKVANTTTIFWQEVNGGYQQATKGVSLYAFDVSAAPFGNAAPRWDTLPPGLTKADGPYPITWDSPLIAEAIASIVPIEILAPNAMFFAPLPGDPPKQLFLDSAYSELKYSAANPGWAILTTDGDMFQTFHVVDARQTAKAAYALNAKTTRLTFAENISGFTFPLRNTTVLTGSLRLPLQKSLPLADPLSGSTLILAGIHSQLNDGQTVVLRGNLFDPAAIVASSTPAAESAILHGAPQPDPANNITTINVKRPLANQYVRATCTLLANIVEVTQGETLKDEILGSGDGTAFQSYPLKKKPLTYLPSANPEGVSAVDSTLIVTVDGVAWQEKANLVNSVPHAREYMTALDASGQTTVIFGDGFNGARPNSGVNNIHARYRKGLGASGNLPSNAIQQLVDNIPNLQKAANPLPSRGGSDPASAEDIRTLGPAGLQAFGRAVSAGDYAALALSFPGIAKASATWVLQDAVTLQAVLHPYVRLTAGTFDRVPFQGTILAGQLRRFLDGHRDPNVPLRVQDFTPVYIAVNVGIDIDPAYPHQATLNRVQAALNPGLNPDGTAGYFAFEGLNFGQSIFLSDLYAAIQGIDGVQDATITVLRRVGPGLSDSPSLPPHDILIRPTELVTIDSATNPNSALTITGQGGFVDV
jgi:predicted phage baseplate assembly protein